MSLWGLASAALVALTLLVPGCAGRQPRAFTVDWKVTEEPAGPALSGQIYNPYPFPARRIRLLVEGLDASGNVVNRTLGVIESIVRSRESLPFSVPVPAAPQYRVSVLSWDLQTPTPSPGRR